MRKRCGFFDFGYIFLPRRAAEVINDDVSAHATNETGKPLRLSNVSPPDLFQDEAEGFLEKIFSGAFVANSLLDDDSYAAAVTFDQFGLRLPVTGYNAIYQFRTRANIAYGHRLHIQLFE